ncbi:MAG TPA: nitrilase-related carbon-nitrogen hydrolase, partial [Pilimelia sp.]|nr:nitrilase-related carbon-nitrogen hydrolase [Pilimelia sp.]
MRIAAAQARAPWLDPTAGVAAVVDHLGRAAAEGVSLVAFPETFLSGYPIWLSVTGGARFDDPAQKAAYAAYLDAAVTLHGAHLTTVRTAVGDLGVFCYLGITERVRGTVYCTLVAIDPDRGVVSAHRKLVPTYEERLVWGAGDGHGLRTHG